MLVYAGKVEAARVINRFESPWIRGSGYMDELPVYSADHLNARFRAPKIFFSKLRRDLLMYDYGTWRTKVDAAGKEGIRSEIEILACLRLLGTGR